MTFIGIVAKKTEYLNIRKNFTLNLENNSTIIWLQNNNIDSIKNVKFETLLICSNNICKDKCLALEHLLKCAKYIIVNSDVVDLNKLKETSGVIITFGLKAKSTITMSSLSEENICICLQREFENVNKINIEPQEICINTSKLLGNKYSKMGSLALKLLYESQNF